MTDLEYQRWWQYHLRVARGESLNETEATLYRLGVDEHDREEATHLQFASLSQLRQLRHHIQDLTQRLEQLTSHSEQLDVKITALEQTYQQVTGHSLSVDPHATS